MLKGIIWFRAIEPNSVYSGGGINMNYHYKIVFIAEKEHWIHIRHDNWAETAGFLYLVQAIQRECNGEVIDIGDDQYKVIGSKLDVIYQWDSCFGSVVIYNKKEQKESVIEFLENHFIKLNVT